VPVLVLAVQVLALETVHFVSWLLAFEACSQVADAKLSLLVADVALLLLLLLADVAATKLNA